jgi:hypothetical protein
MLIGQSILALNTPPRLTTRFLLLSDSCTLSDERTGLRLQVLLVLAGAVILGSGSLGMHGHILLSQFRECPRLKGQVPVIMYPRMLAAQLYPKVLFSSPPTTGKVAKAFEPTSTRGTGDQKSGHIAADEESRIDVGHVHYWSGSSLCEGLIVSYCRNEFHIDIFYILFVFSVLDTRPVHCSLLTSLLSKLSDLYQLRSFLLFPDILNRLLISVKISEIVSASVIVRQKDTASETSDFRSKLTRLLARDNSITCKLCEKFTS